MTIITDLSPELVDEILFRTPLTSLQAVRSTSKQWNASSKQRLICKARARDQFLGFMKMDSKVSSVRFQGELDDLSIKQVAKLNQFQISQVFHCDGLLLCVSLNSKKLIIWNPYLNQTRIIEPTNPYFMNHYGIGYDSCGRYKILRFLDCLKGNLGDNVVNRVVEYEIYDFDSNSWRGLNVDPDWDILFDRHGVSLKGRTYWMAQDRSMNTVELDEDDEEEEEEEGEDLRDHFLVCFDYTSESFGPHLKLPFKEMGLLSSVREEQLAVLFQHSGSNMMEIWVTTKIELDNVTWSKLFVFDMTPREGIQSAIQNGSFVIDEDKKVAMVFDLGSHVDSDSRCPNIVYIIGEDEYYKEVNLGRTRYRPILCSYVPSFVQIEQAARGKRKREIKSKTSKV